MYIGNYNIHVDEDNPEIITFNDFMESFNLKTWLVFQHTYINIL